LWRDYLMFTYDRWGSSRIWYIPRARIPDAYLRRRALMDVLEVHYYNEQNQARLARFIFLKDPSLSAAQLEAVLRAQP
jgi:hypothetical protein